MADFYVSVQQLALGRRMSKKRVLVGYGSKFTRLAVLSRWTDSNARAVDVDAVANWYI